MNFIMSNKKRLIFIIFGLVFIIMCLFLYKNKDSIDTNFYSLININYNLDEKKAIDEINSKLSKELTLLSDNLDDFNKALELFKKSELFDNITYKIDNFNFLNELNYLKLATLNKKSIEMLENNQTLFFKKSAEEIFNKFSFKPLQISDDFFFLAQNSNLINQSSNIKFDPSLNRLITNYHNKKYFFAKASLKNNYVSDKLIDLYKKTSYISTLNNSEIILNSGALYSAFGKANGQNESLYMSIISSILCAVVIYLLFGHFRVLWLCLVIIFGLIFGLSATILIFGEIHILALIISSSLIGLMLDFSLHWLSKNMGINILSNSIKDMCFIFLLGLFITTLGYAVFFFTPLLFLKQIAVFSIFALIGAFLITYFLIPLLFENKKFKTHIVILNLLDNYIKGLVFLSKFSIFKYIFWLSYAFICIYLVFNLHLKDNISEYSGLDKNLYKNSIKTAKITAQNTSFNFAIINDKNILNAENNITNYLLKNHLISSYIGLSKIFIDENSQDKIKNIFKSASKNKKILNYYYSLGINKDILNREFQKISNVKTLSLKEILDNNLTKSFGDFLINKNKSLIYINGVKDKEKVSKILKNNSSSYIDFKSEINSYFSQIRTETIYLKVVAYVFAFILLSIFLGYKTSLNIILTIVFTNLLTLFILNLLGLNINIFAIFGLILSGAVGIDYMIFSTNKMLEIKERIFGIFTAAITTIFSFFVLFFSKTEAVSLFGLSVSINIALCLIFASFFCIKEYKI